MKNNFTSSIFRSLSGFLGIIKKVNPKLLSFLVMILFSLNAFAHAYEIRFNDNNNGTVTWYVQTYHSLGCGIVSTGININGTNYDFTAEFSGDDSGLSPNVFGNCSPGDTRGSYATVTTPYISGTLSISSYSPNSCWSWLCGSPFTGKLDNQAPSLLVVPPSPVSISMLGRTSTYTGVNVNGTGTNKAIVAPGASVSLSFSRATSVDGGCGGCCGCITQHYLGVNNVQIACLFSTTGNSSAAFSGSFTAPVAPGVYYITQTGTWWFSCNQFGAPSFLNDYTVAIGVIVVGSPQTFCPFNVTKNNDPGTCGAVVTYPSPDILDNKPGGSASRIAGLSSGSVFPIGNSTVTFQATDASSNTTVCSFTVTVVDASVPIITCPSNVVATAPVGVCSANVCYPTPTATACSAPATPSGYTFLTSFGNSYYYKATSTSNFTTAQTNAKAAGGHLAVITSAGEQAAIQASAPGACWMGGGDIAVEGTFKWFDCEPLSYTNFCAGEPNGGTTENYLEFEAPGCWNDLNLNQLRLGLLEIEGAKITQTAGLAQNASFPVGVTTNTFMATNAAGNTATCSFTVGVSATSCKTPVQIYHTDTTSNSGRVKWLNPNGNCTTGYELRIRVEITPGVWGSWTAWGPANGTLQHVFSGLAPNSFYNYQIHTNCGPAKNSADVNDWFHTLGGGGALVDDGQVRTYNNIDQIVNDGNSNAIYNLNSLEEILPMNLTFVPNPANDFTAVSIQGFEQHEKTITMIDLNGKLVFNVRVAADQNQIELELARLNVHNGVYLIRVSDGSKQKTGQLVIQK